MKAGWNKGRKRKMALAMLMAGGLTAQVGFNTNTMYENATFVYSMGYLGSESRLGLGTYFTYEWIAAGSSYTNNGFYAEGKLYTTANGHRLHGGWISDFTEIGEVGYRSEQHTGCLVYQLKINEKHRLGAGVHAGYYRSRIDFSKARWYSQFNGLYYDSSLPSGERLAFNVADVWNGGFGMVYYYNPAGVYARQPNYREIMAGGGYYLTLGEADGFYGSKNLNRRWNATMHLRGNFNGVPWLMWGVFANLCMDTENNFYDVFLNAYVKCFGKDLKHAAGINAGYKMNELFWGLFFRVYYTEIQMSLGQGLFNGNLPKTFYQQSGKYLREGLRFGLLLPLKNEEARKERQRIYRFKGLPDFYD
jgi:hypothetical protein